MDSSDCPYQELRQGDTSALSTWIARGGQIDAPLLGAVAETWTPLMLACAEGDLTLVRTFIETGGARAWARVGSKVLASTTPLHVASRYGHAGIAAALLELGAVVDARDTIGMTSLQYAAGNGHLKTMGVLLVAGADDSAMGSGGATALDLAEIAGFEDAATLLKRQAVGGEPRAARRKALGEWLGTLGCEEYLGRFLRAGYDDLPFMASQKLTEADLDCVGIPEEKLGLRKKLLAMHGVEEFLYGTDGDEDGASDDSGNSNTDDASTATSENSEDDESGESSASGEEESVGRDDSGNGSGSDDAESSSD